MSFCVKRKKAFAFLAFWLLNVLDGLVHEWVNIIELPFILERANRSQGRDAKPRAEEVNTNAVAWLPKGWRMTIFRHSPQTAARDEERQYILISSQFAIREGRIHRLDRNTGGTS